MSAQWTFMVYMAGNNSLSDAAGIDLDELRKVGSTDDVKMLAFVAQSRLSGTAQRLQVEKNGTGEQIETLQHVDSGDPQTVMDFIRWGLTRAPAEKYAIVLWNHGGGGPRTTWSSSTAKSAGHGMQTGGWASAGAR